MLGYTYNTEKVHKINFLLIIIICVIYMSQILISHSQNMVINFAKPTGIIILASVVFLTKIYKFQPKAVAFSLIPSITVLYLIDHNSFSIDIHYILIISLIMAGMYFDYRIIVATTIIQDIMIAIAIYIKPLDFIGYGANHIYEIITFFALFNLAAFVVGIVAKQGKVIINNSINNYLELSALYGEVADRELEINKKSRELILKEEEIGSLYNQVAASEEELKWQYTEIEQKQQQINRSELIFRAISETSNDGIWYIDVKENKKVYSKNWCEVLGFSETELSNMDNFKKLIHPEDQNIIEKAYNEHLSKRTEKYKCQYRIKNKFGKYLWVDEVGKMLKNDNGEPLLVVGANTDITKMREQNEKIEYLAYCDVLTGLPNRIRFYDLLTASITEHKAKGKQLGVILIDLDNFKMINDGFSHSFGDVMLKSIADKLAFSVESDNTLARFGGDGFAILLNCIKDYSDIVKLSERISESLYEPISANGQDINVRCSMGFAVYPNDGDNYEELLKNADTALYNAKMNGKNRCEFYNSKMKGDILHKIEIEKNIKAGIKKEEFILYFQPQIDIRSNKIRGFEALVRWNRDNVLISPDKFIPIAEETGLIIELGEWILMKACCKNKEWDKLYNAKVIISVNISVMQLNHRGFVQYVKKVLEISGMSPEYLELEITESMLIGSFEESVSKLNELRKLGVKIALDDFGTGYSSLNYLQNLPIDTLKIDKTFIDGISDIGNNKGIVGSIINLTQNLGLNTIAEGVETKDQLQYLTQNGCGNVQGYIFSRPLPEEEAVKKLYEDFSVYKV